MRHEAAAVARVKPGQPVNRLGQVHRCEVRDNYGYPCGLVAKVKLGFKWHCGLHARRA